MGLWNFFAPKQLKIGDEFFGEMLFMETSNSTNSYFECQRMFEPTGEIIEIGINGDLSGPTQGQKDFFRQIEKNYSLLTLRLIPFIEQEFSAWMKQPNIKNFDLEFKPGHLSIPSCEEQPIAWEITFDTIHDLNHLVTVGMLGNEPQFVQVDG